MTRHAIALIVVALMSATAIAQKISMSLGTPPQADAPLQVAGAFFNETMVTVLLVNVSGRTVEQTTVGLVLDDRASVGPSVIRIGKACVATVAADGFLVITNAHNGFDNAESYFEEKGIIERQATIGLTHVRFADGTEWVYPLEAKGRFDVAVDQGIEDKVHALVEQHFPNKDVSWAFADGVVEGRVSRCAAPGISQSLQLPGAPHPSCGISEELVLVPRNTPVMGMRGRWLDPGATACLTVDPIARMRAAPPQSEGLSRAQWTGIGAAVGAGAGALFGTFFCFVGDSGTPHKADVLMGAGIGAGAGAIIARVLARKKPHAGRSATRVSVAPTVSRSSAALMVTLTTQ